MKLILRSTLILSISSAVTIAMGLASAKLLAVLLGPEGLGLVGLLQGLIGLAVILAGLGVPAGVIRIIARALARGDEHRVAIVIRASWLITLLAGGAAALFILIVRNSVAKWFLGHSQHGDMVAFMALALVFSLMSTLQTSILNAHHRIGALAKSAIVGSVLSAGMIWLLVWQWGEAGIAPALVLGAVATWIASRQFLHREVPPVALNMDRHVLLDACRELLGFGLPYTASVLVGNGVQLAIPVLVLHLLDQESVGYYRAAMMISVGYLGFLLTAMAKDYLPRVSAVTDQPSEIGSLVNQQNRLVMLIGVPIIFVGLALAPFIVPIIYSPAFGPTVAILEWQLLADLFKLPSWTMSVAILVRRAGATYFATELVAGLSLLGFTVLGVRIFGIAGLGIAFVASYAIYYVVVWIIVRRDISLVWSADNKRMMALSLAGGISVSFASAFGGQIIRSVVPLLIAFLITGVNVASIWREYRHAIALPHMLDTAAHVILLRRTKD